MLLLLWTVSTRGKDLQILLMRACDFQWNSTWISVPVIKHMAKILNFMFAHLEVKLIISIQERGIMLDKKKKKSSQYFCVFFSSQ